ncbi:ABC transporter permease [Dongia sedimenti]|uniref:ABC transporter permease n=1 Tax=Dongia sedimenti TaxID=3064282 RepID=A0ABU0YQM4_9PROT|nr:ABC transporter permease [Rhodospirillaceae bacterium R-7]
MTDDSLSIGISAPGRKPVFNGPALFWFVICALPVVAVCLPLGLFLATGFWHVDNGTMVPALSLDNYVNFFSNPTYVSVLLQTLTLAAEVAAGNMLIGFGIAYFIWRCPPVWHFPLLVLGTIPLLMSYIIKLYALRSILGNNGFLNQALVAVGLFDKASDLFLFNQTSILITMGIIYLPFSILPIYLTLERIPLSLLHASADLGGSAWQTFRHVTLPCSLPGTVVGGMFSLILALGDFVTPQMVGGVKGFTFGRLIWSQFGMAFDWPFGAAMATILLVLSIGVIVIAGAIIKRTEAI